MPPLMMIRRGRVRRIHLYQAPIYAGDASVVIALTDGSRHEWHMGNKILACLGRSDEPITVDQYLSVLRRSLSPAQKAWLTRWLTEAE